MGSRNGRRELQETRRIVWRSTDRFLWWFCHWVLRWHTFAVGGQIPSAGVYLPASAHDGLSLLSWKRFSDQNFFIPKAYGERRHILQEKLIWKMNMTCLKCSPVPIPISGGLKNKLPSGWARMWLNTSKKWQRRPISLIRALSTFTCGIALPPNASSTCGGYRDFLRCVPLSGSAWKRQHQFQQFYRFACLFP